MITVGLIVLAAAIALGIAMQTRLPVSAVAIVAGVALQVLGASVDVAVVRDGLLISATFLVFSVGAEIERRPLIRYLQAAFGLAAMMSLVTAGAGLLLWMALDLDGWTATYLVVALAASSTLVVFELLRNRQRLFEPIGRIVSATALVQDLLVIIALSVFAALANPTASAAAVLAGVVGLACAGLLLARWVAFFVMQGLNLDEEERLLFILLVLFSFAAIARWTGGAFVTGAYFAGMAISRFPVGGLARGYLKSFSDFFTTLFYVSLGVVVTLPSPRDVVAELLFVAAILLVRPIVLLPLVRRAGLTVRSSVEAVTLLAQAGELSVIVAIIGMELGHIGSDTLGTVVAVVVLTTAIVPWLSSDSVTWRITHWYPAHTRASLEASPSGHVLLLGCGETGTALLAGLRERSVDVVVVEDDPGVVELLAKHGVEVIRGDASEPAILAAARAEHALAIVSTMRRMDDNSRLLAMAPRSAVLVRVFSEEEAEHVRKLGGHPVIEAELAAEALVAWHAERAGRGVA